MNSRFARNLGWIFFGNIAHAVFQFLLNIICARAFGANDYGLINYGASIIAFFTAIGTLGFNCVVTKFFAEDEEKAGEILGTGYYARLALSVLSIMLLQVLVSVGRKPDLQIRVIILCQSFSILFASSDLFVYWYRYRNEAKTVAIIRLIAFFIAAIWKLVAILIYHSIVLYVIGVSLETGFFTAFQRLWYKKLYRQYKFVFKLETLKRLLKISYPFIFSSLLVTVYGQTDKVMLKNMLSNTAVGLYSVSLTLAGAISIIPTALMDGFRPDIMTSRIADQKKYSTRCQKL